MTSPSEFGAPLTLIHIRFTPIRPRTCYTACQNSPTMQLQTIKTDIDFLGDRVGRIFRTVMGVKCRYLVTVALANTFVRD